MYICISKGRGTFSKLIRFFTSALIRREVMVADKVNVLLAPILLFFSIFNFTKYSKFKAEYNHSFLVYFSEDFNNYMAIDILENGIVIMPASKSFERSDKVAVIETTLDLFSGVKKSSRLLGKKYDYKGIVGAFWYILKFIFTGKSNAKTFQSSKRFFCSEYVTSIINNSGNINIGDPAKIYPITLYKLTKQLKNFNTLIEKENLKIKDIENINSNKQE